MADGVTPRQDYYQAEDHWSAALCRFALHASTAYVCAFKDLKVRAGARVDIHLNMEEVGRMVDKAKMERDSVRGSD